MIVLDAGGVRIHRIEEFLLPMIPLAEMFVGTEHLAAEIAALGPRDYDAQTQRVVMSSSSYLVEAGVQRVLVDTGVGNDKVRERPVWDMLRTSWLAALRAVCDPSDITHVVSTHLHCDHVGWSTTLDANGEWVPTFPRARYVYNSVERDFIEGPEADTMIARNGDFRADSIHPVFDAQQAEVRELPTSIGESIALEAAPGDTPGHLIVRVRDPHSGDTLAIITGDAIHHVLQIAHPELASRFCSLSGEAETTRRRVLDEAASAQIPLLAGHIGSFDLLRIARDESGVFEVDERASVPARG